MNHWEILYRSRKHSVNQNVFISRYYNEPQTFVEEMVNQKERLKGSALHINIAGSPLLYAREGYFPYFQVKTFLSTSMLKM